jgi:vancomycin aglycone glucosyltransferase
VAVAVRLREFGAEVRVCAPPDWAERLTRFDVPLVPLGPPVRRLVHGATRPSVAGTIRTDGATVAATLLLDAVSRERPPIPA